MNIWTAAAFNQEANDSGQGSGGLWTNSFIARGLKPKDSDGAFEAWSNVGKNMVALARDGSERKQTTCYLKIGVFNKEFDEERVEYKEFWGRDLNWYEPEKL